MIDDLEYIDGLDFLYDSDGRLLKAPILVDVCSPMSGKDSAVDPSTMRRYGISCPMPIDGKRCNSMSFMEDGQGNLVCRTCGIELGTLAIGETLQ
jgi:hypothetical protein